MSHRNASPDPDYAWFAEGSLPHSREDRIANALALVALVFSLTIGLVIALLPVSASAATMPAPAAQATQGDAATKPSLVLSAFKIVPAAPGAPEHLVEAAKARAGDQLEYQAVYRNPTAATVRHVVVTVPVPRDGVEYVLDTATPRADLASADGKQYAPLPLLRTETGADGQPKSRPAPGADYRFLRWDLGDVPAGATRTVRTRVLLVSTSVATR